MKMALAHFGILDIVVVASSNEEPYDCDVMAICGAVGQAHGSSCSGFLVAKNAAAY